MFEIIESHMLAPNIHMLKVVAEDIAREAQPGQFIIVRAEEEGERIPLSLSDWDAEEGTVTMIFVVVGRTTNTLSQLKAGMSLPTVAGPLGNPLEIKHFGTALCLGGCYGIGSIYPIARKLKAHDNKVIIAIEAKSSFLLYWEKKLASVCDQIIRITRDGSAAGYRGHVDQLTEIIRSFDQPVDWMVANGCNMLMMKGAHASRPLGIPTQVCLNTIMIDGTGMCGVCRVTIGDETKFACVDGPYFDGHQVNWDELFKRRKMYIREEVVSMRSSRGERSMELC